MNLERSLPDYQPKRFGLKFEPPTIVLQYLVPSTGKLYHHRMRLRNLQSSSNPVQILENLKRRHSMYLVTSKIQDGQILQLIQKIIQKLHPGFDYNSFDLNKLPPQEVQKHKDRMEDQFRIHSKRPGDPGYIYDCRREFKPGEEESSWDEDF